MELPNKKYNIIYADPPWKYENPFGTFHGRHGDVNPTEKYYSVMELKDIKNIKIPATKNAWLIMWVTSIHLPCALEVMKEWGFEYRTCAIWDKKELGLGWFFRLQHEILLIGKKGNPSTPKIRVRSIFSEKRTIHSRKPICVRSWINKAFPTETKIELFARQKIEGWDAWGNEIPKEEQRLLNGKP